MKILVLNGPNLNLLGARDKNHYGTLTLQMIEDKLVEEFADYEFQFIQSNHEGVLIDKIQGAEESSFVGIIINPGGYSHTSVAIRDAITECKLPVIEVHLSNLSGREHFRQQMITASACNGYISGFKEKGYLAAVYLLEKL